MPKPQRPRRHVSPATENALRRLATRRHRVATARRASDSKRIEGPDQGTCWQVKEHPGACARAVEAYEALGGGLLVHYRANSPVRAGRPLGDVGAMRLAEWNTRMEPCAVHKGKARSIWRSVPEVAAERPAYVEAREALKGGMCAAPCTLPGMAGVVCELRKGHDEHHEAPIHGEPPLTWRDTDTAKTFDPETLRTNPAHVAHGLSGRVLGAWCDRCRQVPTMSVVDAAERQDMPHWGCPAGDGTWRLLVEVVREVPAQAGAEVHS